MTVDSIPHGPHRLEYPVIFFSLSPCSIFQEGTPVLVWSSSELYGQESTGG